MFLSISIFFKSKLVIYISLIINEVEKSWLCGILLLVLLNLENNLEIMVITSASLAMPHGLQDLSSPIQALGSENLES